MTSLLNRALAHCCLGLACSAVQCAPFTPRSDTEIVQSLPGRLDAAARAQRAALARDPRHLPLALATARAAIDRGRRYGDPRELGLAQAALAPWWTLADPPPAVRLLRATVRQAQHDFAAALLDLDVLVGDLSTGPAAGRSTGAQVRQASVPLAVQAQAGLTRASVLKVTGRLDEARMACQSLLRSDRYGALNTALEMPARACLAELRSLQGEPQKAAIELAALARHSPADRWLALVRAELAERLGDSRVAEAQYRAATSVSDTSSNAGGSDGHAGADVYSVAAFADWLLSQGRNAEALAALDRADPEADALLLRRAIALHRLGDAASEASARQIGATLDARFEAARLRAENFHQREQARLVLDLHGRADQALPLALDNWSRQKEPADALLLMRAAVAAGQPGAAEPVQRLLDRGYADVRLLRAREAAGSDVAKITARTVHAAPKALALGRLNPDLSLRGAHP
jgi:tetratricopeptide (TPR) repeat protein